MKKDTSVSIIVGYGLVVYGSIEAINRVQQYILIDSNHPVEKEDTRRILMNRLKKAENKFAKIEEILKEI